MITERERAALAFIVAYQRDSGGVSPSLEDMRAHFGRKRRSGMARLVSALIERGYIQRLPNRARSISIVRRATPRFAAFKFDDETKELRPLRNVILEATEEDANLKDTAMRA